MSVSYKNFDGRSVSEQWHVVLTGARRAGVRFRLNSGHRTMAEQQHLFDLFQAGQGHLAARPSANAPHIRSGRIDHALDVEADDTPALMAWGERNGVVMRRTVPGELWHLESSAAALQAFAAKHSALSLPTLRQGQKGPAVEVLQRRLHALGFASVPDSGESGHGFFGKATLSAVRRFQTRHRLDDDGIVGERTHRALIEAVS